MSDSHPEVLNRKEAVARALPCIQRGGPILQRLIDYGSRVLRRTTPDQVSGALSAIGPSMLYRHLLELADAMQVLLDQACVDASAPTLRAMFEAWLSLKYIFEDWDDDTQVRERSMAYLCVYAHRRIQLAGRLDRKTPGGKEMSRLWALEFEAKMPTAASAEEASMWRREVLEKPEMRPIEDEYERLRKARKKRPDFYNLFDGPVDIKRLAEQLKYGTYYESLYRQWSEYGHSAVSSTDLAYGFTELRLPDEMVMHYAYSITFLEGATNYLLKLHRPLDELQSFANWAYANISLDMKRLLAFRFERETKSAS